MNNNIEIHSSLFLTFLKAGDSLRLLLREEANQLESIEPDQWYPLDTFNKFLEAASKYKNHDCIIKQIGIEMMHSWYRHGPGKNIISSGIDFLYYQSSSEGYRSVIKGPPDIIGSFELIEVHEMEGTAKIYSKSILPRALDLGVLIGGLDLTGNLLYYDVKTTAHEDYFDIYFVTQQNRRTLSWNTDDVMEEIEWRFKHYINKTEEKEKYWNSINETLNSAYIEMQNAMSKVKILSGMLPICASCKKIRDDKGYWNQIETYIRENSEAEFSHSICPDCIKKLYSNIL